MSDSRPFEITRGVLPIGAAITAIVIVIGLIGGSIMFITGLSTTTAQNSKDINSLSAQTSKEVEALTARINTIDISQQALSTKQSVQDVKLDTILDRIQEIKTTLDKSK